MLVTLPYIFDILLIQGVLTLRYDNQGINVKYIRNFYPKADTSKWYFLSQVFRIVLIFPHISDYLINNRKCIQISIQSRMNSLRYENVINRLFKKLQGGCSFFFVITAQCILEWRKKINESSPQGRHGVVFLSVEWRCV